MKWLAGIFVAAVVVALPAHATVFPAEGGAGDRAEDYRCAPGQILVGFHGRTGSWIDQVGLICAVFSGPTYQRGALLKQSPRGGNGGTPNEQYCQGDAGIREITVGFLDEWKTFGNDRPKQIWAISFSCARPRDGSSTGPALSFNGDLKGVHVGTGFSRKTTNKCPGSEYATGLNIRYGKHVNAVGLICGAVEAPLPTADDGNAGKKVTGLGKKPVGEALTEGMQNDTDRPGSDIHRFELQDANPGVCQARCAGLDRCKAWTYVRPGMQGPKAVCYLKNGVPQAASNKCCISGAKPNRTSPGALQEPDGFATATARRCKSGFVWREARPADVVCVTPESRSIVAQENQVAPSRWDPSGAYGPNTCIAGFVWREAFDGDVTCVTPERRAAVKEENRVGPSRTE